MADIRPFVIEAFQKILEHEVREVWVERETDPYWEGYRPKNPLEEETIRFRLGRELGDSPSQAPAWKPGDPLPEGYEVTSTSRHGTAIEAHIAPVEPKTTEQVVIVDVPKGYQAVDYRSPRDGEFFLYEGRAVDKREFTCHTPRIILEKLDD